MNEAPRLIPLVPGIMRMIDEPDVEQIQNMGNTQLITLSRFSGLFARYMEKLIELFLEYETHEILCKFQNNLL